MVRSSKQLGIPHACPAHILLLLFCYPMLLHPAYLLLTNEHADSLKCSHHQCCYDQPVIKTNTQNNPLKVSWFSIVITIITFIKLRTGVLEECLTTLVAILMATPTAANANIEAQTATTMVLLSSSAIISRCQTEPVVLRITWRLLCCTSFNLAVRFWNAANPMCQEKEISSQHVNCTWIDLMREFRVHSWSLSGETLQALLTNDDDYRWEMHLPCTDEEIICQITILELQTQNSVVSNGHTKLESWLIASKP